MEFVKVTLELKMEGKTLYFIFPCIEIYNKESTSSIQLNEDIKNYFIKIK